MICVNCNAADHLSRFQIEVTEVLGLDESLMLLTEDFRRFPELFFLSGEIITCRLKVSTDDYDSHEK